MKKYLTVFAAGFIVLVFFTSSCKKIFTNPNTYTLRGKVYLDCSKTPIPNTRVVYIDNGIAGLGTGIHNGNLIIGADTTDANGNFEISYQLPKGVTNLIEPNLYVDGVNSLKWVPETKNIDDIEIYAQPTTLFKVNLIFQNPRTSADTLYIAGFGSAQIIEQIIGPFSNHSFNKYYSALDPKYNIPDSTGLAYKFGVNGKWNESSFYKAYPCGENTMNININ